MVARVEPRLNSNQITNVLQATANGARQPECGSALRGSESHTTPCGCGREWAHVDGQEPAAHNQVKLGQDPSHTSPKRA